MKRQLAIILSCVLLILSTVGVFATGQENQAQVGFTIVLNDEMLDASSVIYNNIHYVPFRLFFEKMGAFVFYRNCDGQVLALTRDGDMIYHIIGGQNMIVNGDEHSFEQPSVLVNGETYISIDMIVASLCPADILFENQQLHIIKPLITTDYHLQIQDVLDVSHHSNFYPEKFQKYLEFHMKKPSFSMEEILFRVNLGLNHSFYENVAVIEHPYELAVLVNKYHRLPENFTQYNLVHMNRGYTVNDGKQYLLAAIANENYMKMADAAKADGVSMRVVSAYRTESYQRSLYNNKLRATGKVNADNYSARPGHSEHQTGLAVDINSTYVSFEYSAAFKWLQNHAHEYGFILRYPKGKEWITGYSYEPWHYRYIGVDAATIVHNEGITYEEYYAKYVAINEFQ